MFERLAARMAVQRDSVRSWFGYRLTRGTVKREDIKPIYDEVLRGDADAAGQYVAVKYGTEATFRRPDGSAKVKRYWMAAGVVYGPYANARYDSNLSSMAMTESTARIYYAGKLDGAPRKRRG